MDIQPDNNKSYHEYSEILADLNNQADELHKKRIRLAAQSKKIKHNDPYHYIQISYEFLHLSEEYCHLNYMFKEQIGYAKPTYLQKAKFCYLQALKTIMPITGSSTIVSFDEKQKVAQKISAFTNPYKLLLFKNLQNTLGLIWQQYSSKSRWNYFFLDLDGMTTMVMNNMLMFDMDINENETPVANRLAYTNMTDMVIESLNRVSEGYSMKYEHKTHLSADLSRAIEFKKALLAIYEDQGNKNASIICKNQIKTWEDLISSN